MVAKYILATLGCAFLIAGVVRLGRGGAARWPQARTWLLIGIIFAAVSGWLFVRG